MSEMAIRGTCELFAAWYDTLLRSETVATAVLQFLHGRSQRTWRAGHAIQSAICPIRVALCSAARFLTDTTPTLNGSEETVNGLRANIGDKLSEFNAGPLLDELAAAVVADCTIQRGGLPPGDVEHTTPTPAKERTLNITEQSILTFCRRKPHKGEIVANEVGLAYSGHIRRVLSKLVKEGWLRMTDEGYRTVSRANAARRRAT